MRNIYITLIFFIFCSFIQQQNQLKIILESEKVDSAKIKYFSKIDKDFNNKTFVCFETVNKNDFFVLKSESDKVFLINNYLKHKSVGGLFTAAYVGDLKRNNNYILKIEKTEHKIKSEILKKYMFIYLDYSFKTKKYTITYTNKSRGYL